MTTNTTAAVKMSDYTGTWYEGDRPNLNWVAFLCRLKNNGRLLSSLKPLQALRRDQSVCIRSPRNKIEKLKK